MASSLQQKDRTPWLWLPLSLLSAMLVLGSHGCSPATTRGATGASVSFGLPTSMEEYARQDPQPQPRPEIIGPVTGAGLDVVLIDVGQGDSILIKTAGGRSILVDAGEDTAAGAVARELDRAGVTELDLFIATHPHSDHIGGLKLLMRRFVPRVVLETFYPDPGYVYRSYMKAIRRKRIPIYTAKRGVIVQVLDTRIGIYEAPDRMGVSSGVSLGPEGSEKVQVRVPDRWLRHALGLGHGGRWTHVGGQGPGPGEVEEELPVLDLAKGLVLRFFLPEKPFITDSRSNTNANSVVFRLDYREVCMIFTGDAEAETESRLLAQNPTPKLRCPVLKVAHHGSNHATMSDLLSSVDPEIALVSAGRFNRHGHPAAETMHKLYKSGAWIYRTDKMGTIRLKTDGKKIDISVGRSEEYWRRYFEKKKKKKKRRERGPRSGIHPMPSRRGPSWGMGGWGDGGMESRSSSAPRAAA